MRGSYCTPRGLHIVRAKIGAGCAENSVFSGRRPTGEIYSPELGARFPDRDWILTRILWLSGCEVGFNRLGDNDTMRRYIYIHGTPDTVKLGETGSHGCIRMRNADLLELSIGCRSIRQSKLLREAQNEQSFYRQLDYLARRTPVT
jgi:hypothetical protein